jgi:hypothetical protein
MHGIGRENKNMNMIHTTAARGIGNSIGSSIGIGIPSGQESGSKASTSMATKTTTTTTPTHSYFDVRSRSSHVFASWQRALERVER